ncbi:MAG TPA: LysM peptidoglycan-binding domain-containing protein [Saprospiraceae bacterium]|nr:LysM peptidoglycan-binding domain-containing protein [Saprospiraceae bacterium]HND88737.1 LysM peptidoglycan-binding domain-containing protein [Saprospiraceae bacterium]HNG89536.1 LysM peptidoglycan-binding domain-containing protein [Saprospiraceae bacterium]
MNRIPRAICLLLFSLFSQVGFSQTEPLEKPVILTSKDSLWLIVEEEKKYILHPVKAKQTLFSIARFYSLSLVDLFEHNPAFRTDPTLRVGSRVKIPIPNKAIKRYKKEGFQNAKNTPIYYLVQPGDNLYQISKRNFDMPVDSVAKRNRLKGNNIKPGQLLHVGWMGTEGVHEDWRPKHEVTPSDALKGRYVEEKKKRREVESQGVCYWQKDSKEKGELYALHRDAAIGTPVGVTNPMFNRTVYAKVIGRIPDGYERNVEIILSPEAARKLGAKDPRFFTKVKYLK